MNYDPTKSTTFVMRTAHLQVAELLGCHPSEIVLRGTFEDGTACTSQYDPPPREEGDTQ